MHCTKNRKPGTRATPMRDFSGGTLELRRYKSIDTKKGSSDCGDAVPISPRPDVAVSVPASPARTYSRGRGSPLTGYDTDTNSLSYNNLSSGTSYYSCVSQITLGFEVNGPVAIGISHWKPPYMHNETYLPFDQSQHNPDIPRTPVSCSFMAQMDLSASLSCPTSLSIIPALSRSNSQDTLSQDTELNQGISISIHGSKKQLQIHQRKSLTNHSLASDQIVVRHSSLPPLRRAIRMESSSAGKCALSNGKTEIHYPGVKDINIFFDDLEAANSPSKDDDSLLHGGNLTSMSDEGSRLDAEGEALGAPEKSRTNGLFFNDGKCRIDYILVYRKSSPQSEKREIFERNIRAEGLHMEKESSIINSDIIFVKLHAPWDVLGRYAEQMNVRMPFSSVL